MQAAPMQARMSVDAATAPLRAATGMVQAGLGAAVQVRQAQQDVEESRQKAAMALAKEEQDALDDIAKSDWSIKSSALSNSVDESFANLEMGFEESNEFAQKQMETAQADFAEFMSSDRAAKLSPDAINDIREQFAKNLADANTKRKKLYFAKVDKVRRDTLEADMNRAAELGNFDEAYAKGARLTEKYGVPKSEIESRIFDKQSEGVTNQLQIAIREAKELFDDNTIDALEERVSGYEIGKDITKGGKHTLMAYLRGARHEIQFKRANAARKITDDQLDNKPIDESDLVRAVEIGALTEEEADKARERNALLIANRKIADDGDAELKRGRAKLIRDEVMADYIKGSKYISEERFNEMIKDAESIQNPIAKAAVVSTILEASAVSAADNREDWGSQVVTEDMTDEQATVMSRVLQEMSDVIPEDATSVSGAWGMVQELRNAVKAMKDVNSQDEFNAIRMQFVDRAARGVLEKTLTAPAPDVPEDINNLLNKYGG